MATTYSDKLKNPKWQKKRLEILNRDNFRCVACGDEETTLNIHHLKYSKEPWTVDSKSLITVCENCHKEIETFKLKIKDISMLKIIRYKYKTDRTIICLISCDDKLILSITRYDKNIGFNISKPINTRDLINFHFDNLEKLGLYF